jgi:predicted nucleic acid-binding protein
VQALNEYCYVAIKKQRRPREEIESALENIRNFCQVATVSVATLTFALKLHEKYGYQFFDCLMLASAIESGCMQIITEDMSSGQVIEQNLTIVNPFE